MATAARFKHCDYDRCAITTAKEERGQQDHYGQDASVRDIGPYKSLVRFTSNSFDLTASQASQPRPC